MSTFKNLEKHETEVVHNWLRTMGFPVNRMLHREYSDGVLVARLLKKIYPRLVDLHTYDTCHSIPLKTGNWQTLNYKVFCRIGLPLGKEQIDSVVKSGVGAIERLLWALMNHTVNEKQKNTTSNSGNSGKRKKGFPLKTPKAIKPSEIPCLSSLNSLTSFNSANSYFSQSRSLEKIGDNKKNSIPYPVYEKAMTEVRHKVLTLEELLRERERDIKVLLERVKVYETENHEYRKFSEIVNEKLSFEKGIAKPPQRVRFNL